MYLIAQGYEIDVPSVVMDHMYYCSAKNRNHSLPYANLLPLFFKHFEVPLEKEEKITSGFGIVDEEALNRIGICQTKDGVWKFYQELTEDEKKEKDFVKPRLTTPKATTDSLELQKITTRLDSMEDNLELLREGK